MSTVRAPVGSILTQPLDPGPDLQPGPEFGGSHPFLTIFTRCCRRPESLERNIESVLRQTSDNWEQLFVVDPTGQHDEDPVLWANKQFERYQQFVTGHYIYPLDDDGLLVDPRFIEMAYERTAATWFPDVLLVKMRAKGLDNIWRTHPSDSLWELDWENGERPKYWVGTGYNVVPRSEIRNSSQP